MKYKYFLFDWDGSLANTLCDWVMVHKQVLEKFGVQVSDEVVAEETLGRLDVRELGIVDTDAFVVEVVKEILPKMNSAEMNPGALEILRTIKNDGGKTGVVTDSRWEWLETAVKKNGVGDLIDVFVTRDDVRSRKPDPEGIEKALSRINGRPHEALMIGDNWRDVEAGRAASVDSCLYFPEKYYGVYKKEEQWGLGATFVVSDFEELKKIM